MSVVSGGGNVSTPWLPGWNCSRLGNERLEAVWLLYTLYNSLEHLVNAYITIAVNCTCYLDVFWMLDKSVNFSLSGFFSSKS